MEIDEQDAVYQQTIVDARSTLGEFQTQLAGLPEDVFACVKTFLPVSPESEGGALVWLLNPSFEDEFCTAMVFEVPDEFAYLSQGQWVKFPTAEIVDWYLLSDAGDMRGGYSLRYQRELLPKSQRRQFDRYIGVERWL